MSIRVNVKLDKTQKNIEAIFRYVAIFGSAIIIGLTAILLFNSREMSLDFSATGINYFFGTIVKAPIYLLTALVTALSGLTVWIKIIQSERQIDSVSKNNIANNYYMHKKEFSSLCLDIGHQYKVTIHSDSAYKSIFPKNSPVFMSFDPLDSELPFEHFFKALPTPRPTGYWTGLANKHASDSGGELMYCNQFSIFVFEVSYKLGLIESLSYIYQYKVSTQNGSSEGGNGIPASNMEDSVKLLFKISKKLASFSHTNMNIDLLSIEHWASAVDNMIKNNDAITIISALKKP